MGGLVMFQANSEKVVSKVVNVKALANEIKF